MDNVGQKIARKKSRLAKNKKKAWRKVDITEVEDFLEDERLQERTGGLVADRPDEQLFVVDKSCLDIQEEPESKKRKREPKPLKCHSHLILDTRIKAARIPHNVRIENLNKRHKNVIEKIKSGVKSKTQIEAEKNREDARLSRKQRIGAIRSMPKATYDLWEDEKDNTEERVILKDKRKSRKAPSLRKKPYDVPAIEVPHPGASYNPTYEDYMNLLAKAHQVEVGKVREERKIHNALESKFPELSRSALEENWLEEMSAGLQNDNEPNIKIEPDLLDKLSVNPPVRREDKKTKTQRNKEKLKKQKDKLKEIEKANKTNKSEIFRLKKIKADIKAREQELDKRATVRHEQHLKKSSQTRKLGKMKYEEPDIEVKLSDELQGSLRKLKPEGNLLEDRYKSLQKRNVIEPRQQARKFRKYKKKLVEKRGHRNITL